MAGRGRPRKEGSPVRNPSHNKPPDITDVELVEPGNPFVAHKESEGFQGSKFQPGQAGSNGAIPGMLTPLMIRRLLSRMWKMNRWQLQRMVEDPNTSMGEITLAAILVKAAGDGDVQKIEFVLNRMIGKVKAAQEKPEQLDELRLIPTEKILELLDSLPKDVMNVTPTEGVS
jgi:hypothetical protein